MNNCKHDIQTIPGWSGYYHEVSQRSEAVLHSVHYLLATIQLPTLLDTVHEVLRQVKVKADALKVESSDCAIYAKGSEIIRNSSDNSLKKM